MKETLIFYMGIDSIKGTLFDREGAQVVTYEEPLNLIVNEEYVEQDPGQWLEIMAHIIGKLQNEKPDANIEIISVTYQPGTFVCIDRSGDHIMNAIMPCDRRAQYQARVCEKRFKKHSENFNVPWENMIYPKILWIKYNRPDVYRKIYKILTPDGFIAYKLCGETAIDNYSASFLGYSIRNGCYNSRIINNSQLDASTFPDVCKVGECIGIISGIMKDELGLKSDVKFIMATNCLVPLSMTGSKDQKASLVYDAESSNISFMGSNLRTKRHIGLIKVPYEEGSQIYSIIGDYECQFLKWILKLDGEIDMENADYSPGDGGVIILPHMLGDSIKSNADTRGGILGINRDTNPYGLITSCFESIGYTLKEKIESISGCGIQVDSIEVLSSIRNELFYRILADITEKRILVNDEKNDIIRRTCYIINNISYEDERYKKEILPREESAYKFRQLFSLYKSAWDSFDYIYKCRRKIMKKTDH